MRMKHIGFRVRGFYRIASLSDRWEASMGTNAQQKLDALTFWDNHGLNATRDAVKVSHRRCALKYAGYATLFRT